MESDDIQTLIAMVAVKHGVALGRDDPILIMSTVNEKLLSDSSKAQKEILTNFKEEIENISHRWGTDSKEKAEKVLNAALHASKLMMTKAMQDGAEASASATLAKLEPVIYQLTQKLEQTERISRFNIIAASLTLLSTCLSVYMFFKFF